jgi:integrase/recombinase XerD
MDRHAATRRAYGGSPEQLASRQSKLTRTYFAIPHVTTMLDAGVDLRDVQIAARHADPRTTMY